jgi:uncharacterized protein
MPLSLEEGRMAVELARETLEARLSGKKLEEKSLTKGTFSELRGVFVTINSAEETPDRLRGCIGFPYPVKPLGEAIREAALAAATEDPRFPPVTGPELGSVVLEVSILTKPEALHARRRQDLPSKVRIGTDGLIISSYGLSGLLLPQVATEFRMDQTEFLSQACMKAGLPPDSWLQDRTEVQVFQAEIFAETSPRGSVARVNPSGS